MRRSLNGTWHFEPVERQLLTDKGLMASRERIPPAGTMELPQNWQLAGLTDFNGRVRFFRRFAYAGEHDDQRVYLGFEGIDYYAAVYLNGMEVGRHEGYFQTFSRDVTDLVGPDNLLEVLVDCPAEDPQSLWPDDKRLVKGVFNHHDARPGGWSAERGQSQATGGIWGDIWLEIKPSTFVESVYVESTLLNSEGAWIRARITVNAQGRGTGIVGLQWDGREYSQTASLSAGVQTYSICFKLDNPRLWWPWELGDPYLYHARAFVRHKVEHAMTVRVGVRQIVFDRDSGQCRVNGKRLFLRGTNMIPAQWLSAYTGDLIDKDIALLREANVNAVRVHGHVNRQAFYQACDQAGLLVWQDFALQWSYQESEALLSSATAQIGDMVRQLFNHPSIFAWCCHNEPSHNAKSLDLVLAQVVQGLDGTRYVHTQSDFSEHPYWGWYLDDYGAFREAPMGPLVTEFGAQAFPGLDVMNEILPEGTWDFSRLAYHNFQWDETVNVAKIPVHGDIARVIERSQQYQAELLKFVIEQYRQKRYTKVGGLFQFMFVDGWPSVSWSVVDVNREPKRGYYALRQAYQPVLPIASLGRRRWSPGRTLTIPVRVVNDTHRAWPEARLLVALSGSTMEELLTASVDVPSDGLSSLIELRWPVPLETEKQQLRLHIEVWDQSAPIGENDYIIEISEAPSFLPDGPGQALNA